MIDKDLADQIIDLRLDGFTNAEIAMKLGSTSKTVASWFKSIVKAGFTVPPPPLHRKYPRGYEY